MLQIAPSGYRRHAARQRNPELRSARAKRDERLVPHIERVWEANFQVYGADKVWRQMNREAIPVARCSVERLMRRRGLQGARRGKTPRTTVPDRSVPCPLDRVNRQFKADRPNQLWVSDFTYVSTWQGWLYVAFVIDVFARRIVGWRVRVAPWPRTSYSTPWSRPCTPGNPMQRMINTTAMPPQVLDGCLADVSLLVGLLIDKFQYHLPLYRQHQRLAQAGITVSRASLMNWVKRSIELLRPIVEAQLAHVLQSRVLAMDETPIKASREQKGKMKQGWFWPVYGEDHEVVFTWSDSRGRQHIEKLLKEQFKGTLVTDGYAAYARYVQHTEGVTHAQCWVHLRRKFVEADNTEALGIIGRLYAIEDDIRQQKLWGEKKREYRLTHSKPVVDKFFAWCNAQCQRDDLTPKHPLTMGLKYAINREDALRVFLEDPEVPPDTNHLEREIRPIPLGRRNWLFCWTELGAEHVGLIQSLISTCKLHDIHPYTYLVDVLQRIGIHPASKAEELTPRLWKEKFADNPLRSALYNGVNHVAE